MRRVTFVRFTAIVIALVTGWGLLASAQQQQPVFRAASDLVTMDVVVTVDGRPVGALGPADFVLTDNGVPQTIESVDMTEVPADITIIIDINHMMSGTITSMVPEIARVVKLVRPGDRVRLMTIDTYVRDLVPLRAGEGFPAFERLDAREWASAQDALAAALMRDAGERRHLIVAVTNGVDTSSTIDLPTLEQIARRASATLHIVTPDLFLEGINDRTNQKIFTTRFERLKGASVGFQSRFWRFHHERPFEAQEAIALGTGGSWTIPGLFSDQNAGVIFRRFYERSQRAYRIRYVPTGVPREGWHDVSISIPKYPSYRLAARPGYSIARAAPVVAPEPATGTLADVIRRYGSGDVAGAMQIVRGQKDVAAMLRDYMDGLHAWPANPQLEAAFVLDLAVAGLADPTAADTARELLLRQVRFVRDPLGPGSFERFWLWSASALTLGFNANELTTQLVDGARERFPDEPRLNLIHAVLLDRRYPGGLVNSAQGLSDRVGILPMMGNLASSAVTRTFLRGATVPASHGVEVLAAYDAAMTAPETVDEARVRKAWVLHRLDRQEEALALLEVVGNPVDIAMEYTRHLFQGTVLETLERHADARNAFERAHALMPEAQSARVALMRHAVMAGDMAEASRLSELVQTTTANDPWWSYWQADFRMVGAAVERMRAFR